MSDDEAMALIARVHWLEAEVKRLGDELAACILRLDQCTTPDDTDGQG